jgi:replicative DNA helicase
LAELPIGVVDVGAATLMSVRADARAMHRRFGGLELIVVDYLQLMTGPGGAENRQIEVSQLAKGLREVAKEFAVPVVEVCQLLHKSIESRRDKRPTLGDLRESGTIADTADVVALLYRDDYYNKQSAKVGVAELIVDKNRHGPRQSVDIAVDMSTGWWGDLSNRDNEEGTF